MTSYRYTPEEIGQLNAEIDRLRKAIKFFKNADTEYRRAQWAAEQPRLSNAGTRYAVAKSKMFRSLEQSAPDSMKSKD